MVERRAAPRRRWWKDRTRRRDAGCRAVRPLSHGMAHTAAVWAEAAGRTWHGAGAVLRTAISSVTFITRRQTSVFVCPARGATRVCAACPPAAAAVVGCRAQPLLQCRPGSARPSSTARAIQPGRLAQLAPCLHVVGTPRPVGAEQPRPARRRGIRTPRPRARLPTHKHRDPWARCQRAAGPLSWRQGAGAGTQAPERRRRSTRVYPTFCGLSGESVQAGRSCSIGVHMPPRATRRLCIPSRLVHLHRYHTHPQGPGALAGQARSRRRVMLLLLLLLQ